MAEENDIRNGTRGPVSFNGKQYPGAINNVAGVDLLAVRGAPPIDEGKTVAMGLQSYTVTKKKLTAIPDTQMFAVEKAD